MTETKKKADMPQKQEKSKGYDTVERCTSMDSGKKTFKGQQNK